MTKTVKKGTATYQKDKQGNTKYEYDFGKPVGSRTNRQTGAVEHQNKMTVILNKHGEVVTAFPS
ncbi:hypothetical protein [Pseudomonas graminis]